VEIFALRPVCPFLLISAGKCASIHLVDVKCKCNNCSESLAFDAAYSGQTVECPHCHMDTMLFILPTSAPAIIPAEGPLPLQQQAVDALQRVASGVAEARCPRRNSDNTQRCEMAWQAGTSTSSFRGLGVDLGGDLGGFGGVKKSSTLLAAMVAPPTKEQPNSWLVMLLICVIAGCLISI
jgi:hypothetical protein